MDIDSRRLAKKIHKLGYIYALYGALDGLSLSYSMIKYSFDLLYTDTDLNASDVMHNWMMTPAGIAAAAAESITLIGFSLLANLFSDDDKNAFKRFIAIIWPYVRDTTKGLKNAYKGVRSTLQAYGLLLGQNVRYLIVPIGLFLGALSVVNRICMRRFVVEPRKVMMKTNAELLLEIQGACCLHVKLKIPQDKTAYKNSYILVNTQLYYVNHDGVIEGVTLTRFDEFASRLNDKKSTIRLSVQELQYLIKSNGGHAPPAHFDAATCRNFRERIGRQSLGLRSAGLLGAAYSGVIDGLYLFMGAIGLAALSSPLLLVMTILCTFFSGICIATRVYEEYDFQRKLIGTQAKIELALLGKELESLVATFQQLADPLLTTSAEDLLQKQEKTFVAFEEKLKEFKIQQGYLDAQVTLSYKSAALAGLKNGLVAYCAIASVMFAVATVCVILTTPFPPAFLLACVISGMACLIGFMIHSLVSNYQHLHARDLEKRQEKKAAEELGPKKSLTLLDISILLKENRASAQAVVKALQPTEIKEAILKGMVVDPSPQFFFQEWFEVVRSFFSGFSKGQKSVDYTLNALQEPDQEGHYQDTPVMFALTVVSAVVHAGALSLRAYARGFGRPDLTDVQGKDIPKASNNSPRSGAAVQQNVSERDLAEKELCELSQAARTSMNDGGLGDKAYTPQRERPRSAGPAPHGYSVATSRYTTFRSIPSPTPIPIQSTISRSASDDNLRGLTRVS